MDKSIEEYFGDVARELYEAGYRPEVHTLDVQYDEETSTVTFEWKDKEEA